MMRWFGGFSFELFKKSMEDIIRDVMAKALVLQNLELDEEEERKLKREIYAEARMLNQTLKWFEDNKKNMEKAVKKAKEVLNSGKD